MLALNGLDISDRPSSSSTCIRVTRNQALPFIEDYERVLLLHGREVIEKVIERLIGREIFQ